MPKLKITHMAGPMIEHIKQLERRDALEVRDIKALLSNEQQKGLQDAWTKQQALRKKYSQPKTDVTNSRKYPRKI
jgi:hypothetical protein